MTEIPRTLVAGVGYPDLCDHSVGPLLATRWRDEKWPPGVVVEDLSYGPIAVVHRLNEARPRFRRFVVAGAVERGRPAGTVTTYRWNRILPDDVEEIQDRVAEAATGVLSLDNLVIVTRALCEDPPDRVMITEIEPLIEAVGNRLSQAVRKGLDQVDREVRSLVSDREADDWPGFPLGGPPGVGASATADHGAIRWNA